MPQSGHSLPAAPGQQATFADTSRVFVLSVRNQEANPAAGGPEAVIPINYVDFRKADTH